MIVALISILLFWLFNVIFLLIIHLTYHFS